MKQLWVEKAALLRDIVARNSRLDVSQDAHKIGLLGEIRRIPGVKRKDWTGMMKQRNFFGAQDLHLGLIHR